MKQRCLAIKEVGNGNWRDYMWPHQLDKATEEAAAHEPAMPVSGHVNINHGKQGMNCVNTNVSNVNLKF